MLADGLTRYILALVALETRPPKWVSDLLPDIVALEEPETHAFPYLVHSLAEHVSRRARGSPALYTVITTHNPYMLVTLLEKTPIDLLAVYYVYMDKRLLETRYIRLEKEVLEELMEEEYASLLTVEDLLAEHNLLPTARQ